VQYPTILFHISF